MPKSFCFTKKIQVLDDKIKSCMSDIANLFNGIENLHKPLTLLNTDEVFTEELYEMLQKLDTILSQTPSATEFIINHLEELRKQNSISAIEDISFDLSNTNENCIPLENLPDKIILLWTKICYHLEKYSSVLLKENYMPLQSTYNNFNLYLLKNFVHNLQYMYVPDLVWQKYRSHRYMYLDNYSCPCSVQGSCLNCCLKAAIQCIYEDEFLAYIGSFHPYTVTQSKIFEIYFEVIDKKFYSVLKVLEDCFTLRRNLPDDILCLLKPFNSEHIETCFTCFMQSQVSSEVDSAVYCIQNNYGIESVWNTVLNSCIVKIIEAILLFEDKINIILHRGEPTYHTHEDELLTMIEGSKLVLATESPEESPISKPLYPSSSKKQLCLMEKEKLFLIWSWRLVMVENRSLIRLQRSLQNNVESILRTFIELEKKKLKSGHWKDLLPSKQETTFFSEHVQTNTLLQSVFNTVQHLEKYLPVLCTKCESFQPFKSSFLHTLETYVVNLIRHLKEISECYDSNCVVYHKYIALNNAIFLKDRLQNYCDVLKGSACDVPENNVLNSITHLTNDLLESVHLLQFRYISCGMLFDAECNKFDDQKPFFEGEHISYCIQMWNLHMKGLLHDISYFLPQRVAKDLYLHVLSLSLEHFLARYSHVTPSEARTPQVLFDINALLLCTSELLWPACSSVCQFIGRKLEMEEEASASSIFKIHSSCSFLLAVLVVLNAPICELHKYFKDGFPQAQLSVRTKYETVAPWLPWIRRELFSEFCQRQIISNVSVWLAVRACTSWCLPNPITVVKAFTEHNSTLSILLMMQAANTSVIETRKTRSLENAKIKLAHSLFELLICFGNHTYIQDILLPVVEKTNGWQEFNVGAATKPLSERSWWYAGLVKTLKSYYISVFEEMIPVWFEVSKKRRSSAALNTFNDFKSSFISHFKCVCEKEPLNSYQDEFELSDEVLGYVCIKKVLESMQRNLASLSQTLKCFLMTLNFHITNYVPEVQSVCQSLPLQLLLSSAIDFLRHPEFQNKISKDLQEMAIITVTALETLLLKTEFFFINDNYTRILSILLSAINEHFTDLKPYLERHSETMHTKEVRDETLEITVYKILQLPNGKNIILYLHQLLYENESWIQKSLGVPGMLSSDIVIDPLSPSPLLVNNPEVDHRGEEDLPIFRHKKSSSQECLNFLPQERNVESFDSGCKQSVETEFSNFSQCDFQDVLGVFNLEVNESISVPKFEFNPLKCFDKLGESNFTQFVIEKPSFHWESIISHLPILGLTEVNFCTLLSHRWDVRNEGPLTDEEQKCIEELKSVYKLTE